MSNYIATYRDYKYPSRITADTMKEARVRAKDFVSKGDKLLSVKKQKEINYIADVRVIQSEDGTVIPLKGCFKHG